MSEDSERGAEMSEMSAASSTGTLGPPVRISGAASLEKAGWKESRFSRAWAGQGLDEVRA